MSYEDLTDRVRLLRAEGYTPKQIAQVLGLSVGVVSPVVRAMAREAEISDPRVRCWVSAGWSVGLAVADGRQWPDRPCGDEATSGLVSVVVARNGVDRVASVCGYLVDTYCLGVKDALGPIDMPPGQLRRFLDHYFEPFSGGGVEAPIELARHLVFGAVDYARGIGFEPAPDFASTAGHLGSFTGPSDITFGHKGKPLFVQGPRDDAEAILQTLSTTIGAGQFDFLVAVPTGSLSSNAPSR